MRPQQTTPQRMQATRIRSRWTDYVLIAFTRLVSHVGLTGTLGLVLLLVSAIYGGSRLYTQRYQEKQETGSIETAVLQYALPATASSSVTISEPPSLPRSTETLALMRKIKKLTKSNELAWSQAEYRLTPITSDSLATLEISTSLKGPYLNLRKVLVELLDQEPALGLRELTLARPNGDSADVDAKIRWVVFLADGWPESPKGKEGSLHD